MRRKVALLLAVIMCLSMAMSGCGNDTQSGGAPADSSGSSAGTDSAGGGTSAPAAEQVLKISIPGNPTDLNPLTSQDTGSNETINTMYEGLTRLGLNGSIETGLAESWDISDDGLTYTFKIREAQWSDGTPVSAKDFEYSWKKALSPELASPYSYLLYCVVNGEDYNTGKITDPDMVGVKAVDDRTFEVKLNQPVPYFPSLVTMSVCKPIQDGLMEKNGEDFALSVDKMVFSGPFMLTEWSQDQRLVVEKNPTYWDKDAVKLDKIIIECVKETNTMVNMFDTEDLDMMLVSPEFIDKYREDPGFGQQADAVVEYFKFNFENEFFANKNIRQAFCISFNRDRFLNQIEKVGSLPAYGYVPPIIPGKAGGDFRSQNGDLIYDTGTDQNAANEAKELLAKGLEEIGKTVEDFNAAGPSLVIGELDHNLKLAQVAQQEWKEILGIDVEIKSLKYALRQAEYDSKKYFIGKEGWGADYSDPMTFLDLFLSYSPQNDMSWANEEYDKLLDSANKSTGDERMEYLLQAEKLLLNDYAITPILYETRNYIQKTYVKGNIRNNVGVKNEYKWAYIEK